MADRILTVSIGEGHPSKVTKVQQWTWAKFAAALTATPPVHEDKAARGWYCPVEFDPVYRDSDNFVARHALTLDCDHVPVGTWERVIETWSGLAFCMYTTASHTPEKPRFRIVMPLSRPVGYDEFQAVVRRVATDIDIELFARESYTPSQMMFLPTVKPGREAEFQSHINDGDVLDADEVLAEYEDWTDAKSWPTRKNADGVAVQKAQTRADEKVGIVGDFCRALSIEDCIERFKLPYVKVR